MALKPKAGDSGAGTIHLSVVEGVPVPSCLPVPQVPTSSSDREEMLFLGQLTPSSAHSGALQRDLRAVQPLLGRQVLEK